ncbi:hypothetical protein BV25DRAFT_296053 [Artomyces pyxidatus]|uniref:Uncharacterized protein n=1 Tax=Artomyces pyxidatus TaxID=48021 RepID=A0ACB8T645_9AGAM|nr:hypothetical protein BV25DRAFT_296053 [Artomyces pyxidatus]
MEGWEKEDSSAALDTKVKNAAASESGSPRTRERREISLLRNLPDDVLLEIMKNLDYRSLVHCQKTCHQMRMVVAGSVSLQYTIELAACGMLDGPRDSKTLDVTERLRRLRLYDAAWRRLDFTERNFLPHLVGCMALSGPSLVFFRPQKSPSDGAAKTVFQQIPSRLRGVEERHIQLAGGNGPHALDYSQDLNVFLGPPTGLSNGVHQYQLRSLSTGHTHPLSTSSPFAPPAARFLVEIHTDFVLEAVLATLRWEYFVWNWKTGLVETSPAGWPRRVAFQSFHFLDNTHILAFESNSDNQLACLHVFTFRDGESGSDTATSSNVGGERPSYRFLLPDFAHTCRSLLPVIAPRCAHGASDTAYFLSDPDDRLLSITAKGVSTLGSAEGKVSIDIPLSTFLSYITEQPIEHSITVPWKEWGPFGSRVAQTPVGDLLGGATLSGMRSVTVRNRRESDGAVVVTVLDYHPRRVARALTLQRDGHGDSGVTVLRGDELEDICAQSEGLRTTLPCILTEIPLPEEIPNSLAETRSLEVRLYEDGILFLEYGRDSELVRMIRKAWAYSF